jgi:hypothetical protein
MLENRNQKCDGKGHSSTQVQVLLQLQLLMAALAKCSTLLLLRQR